MLKRTRSLIFETLIFAVVTLYSLAAFAIFDTVISCITDPCNCGDTEKRKEYHEDELLREVSKNALCPPWDKEVGRDDDTCIVLHDYPPTPLALTYGQSDEVDNVTNSTSGDTDEFGVLNGENPLGFSILCGEDTSETTYFEPKIRVRGQQCNEIYCWTTDDTLNWDGECVTLASGYGIFPLHRMCARIAFPEDDYLEREQDPGYTNGEHLDWKGATVPDEEIVGVDGLPITVEHPKLCLYYDPSLYSLDLGLSIDFMDMDQYYQPIHNTGGVHPLVEIILFFFSVISDTGASIADMLDSLFAMIVGNEEGSTTLGSVVADVFGFLGEVLVWVGELLEVYLNEIAQVNRDVSSTEYGCVNIPLGPYPPPFCDNIVPFIRAEVHAVCGTGNDGEPVASVSGNECHVSEAENTYVRNTVRVGYGETVPLCQGEDNPNEIDTCVTIRNMDAFASAQVMHTITDRKDIIKHCDNSSGGEPCVESMIPHRCSVSGPGCREGFRIVYGKKVGSLSTPQTYFRDDLSDCTETNVGTCQEIWGINRGEFIDVSLIFPPTQTSSDVSPIVENFTLKNVTDENVNFSASIVRVAGFNPTYDLNQSPNQICVFEGENVLGCVDRVSILKPSVYECDNSPEPGITCSSDHFSPKFIVSYNTGTDSITSVIEPKSIVNPNSMNNSINLAGDTFEAFVTDDTFIVKPFSGTNAPTPTSLYGVYQEGIPPLVGSTYNEDARYLRGLEYVNDSYRVGGKYACLHNINQIKCPDDPQMCVLTKLLNSDTVLCSTFRSKLMQHKGMGLCSQEQTDTCTDIDSMPRIDGTGTVAIRSCSNGIKCYDGSAELCKTSFDTQNRVLPPSSLGDTLADDEYYNTVVASPYAGAPSGNSADYDFDKEAVRDKTAIELGLCVEVPSGVCPAEETPSIDTGYAKWPSAELGEKVYGGCAAGMRPASSGAELVRECVANPDTLSFNLEPVYIIRRDPNTNEPYREYSPVLRCIPE